MLTFKSGMVLPADTHRAHSSRARLGWLWMLLATIVLAAAGPFLAWLGRSWLWWLAGLLTSLWTRGSALQSSVWFVYPALIAGAFALWCLPLWHGARCVPLYSVIALGAVATLDAWWLWANWRFGMEYQGEPFTRATIVVDAVSVVILAALGLDKRRRPGFGGNLAFHLLGFVWFGYIAFPYLGESL